MISLKKLLLFPCILFIWCVNGQNALKKKIDSINNLTGIEDKTDGFQKLLQSQDTLQYTEDLGALFQKLAACYFTQKDYEKALPLYKKAVEIQSKYKDKETYNNSRYNITRIYAEIGEKEAEHKLLINIVNDKGDDKFTSYAYRYLSKNAKNKGDISQALYYLNSGLANKALCKNVKIKNALLDDIIAIYANKYNTNITVDPKDFIIVENLRGLIHFNKLTEKSKAGLNNNLAIIYDSFKDLNRALFFYKNAEKGFIKIKDLYNELKVANNIAIIYSKFEKYGLANSYYDKVLNESDDKEQIATALVNKGYYLNSSIAKEKLPYLEKGINTILEKDSTQLFQIPTLTEIKESEYEQDILIYLIDLADHYVHAYHQEKSLQYLHQGKEVVKIIDQLVSLIRYEIDTEDSKLFWIEKGVNIYMLAVEVCYLLNDPANAFYYMEKNKALLLQENIKTLQAKLKLNIPEKLINKEYQLHYKMLAMQEQFQQNTNNDAWKAQFATIDKEYQLFMDSIQKAYPEYVKTKQKVAITSLENTVKAFAEKKESFVEYILNEADGYGIYFDAVKPVFFKIENTPKFHKELQHVKLLMTKRFFDDAELKTYKEVGHKVFTTLFPFEDAVERLKNKKLTIVPDQALQYLPFEILPTQKEGELIENYLVNSTETSYLQSFSLFEQIQQKQNSPRQKLLTIAPQEFQDTQLPTLTGTENIVKLVSTFDESVVLTKKEASKANFLQQQNDFEIIHLNTHAGLDSLTQKPWISFHEDKMTLNELFGLENQADLVILDACQTNDGINLSGEGVINLSRGFFYNGTQSVMASLWSVNEQAGNEILQSFYHELANGTSKSKALQLAKKQYLRNHQFSQNTPYYWAAFTLTGSTNVIEIKTVSYTLYIIFGIVILLIFGIYLVYKKRLFFNCN